MPDGDFRHSERSVTMAEAGELRIEHVAADGTVTVLKPAVPVQAGEVVDAAVMRADALRAFLAEQVADAKAKGVLFSVHLKATMMKVSDPVLFGHAVQTYFADVFAQYGDDLASVGADPDDGLASILTALEKLPAEKREAIEKAITATYESGPRSPWSTPTAASPTCTCRATSSSTPRCRRRSARPGRCGTRKGELQDTKFVIPDSSYAALYAETVAFCREHGAFDPTTMGTVPNVGLMAQKAEEYGSHDKTFEISAPGTVRVVDGAGTTLLEHEVAAGDVWRACQTKDAPIHNWVQLAVSRARATGWPAVFWLDETRAHDAQVIEKVRAYLAEEDTDGLTIEILPVAEATRYTLERAKRGEDTISVTGNVLRDYLTDLFPILELGTSAKMLSIVPLMNGGGLFETGAGGSAPKHVQQLVKENHLRWDSLGEFLALAVSFEFLADKTDNPRAAVLGKALDDATGRPAGEREVPVPAGGRARQPRQPLLPRPVLGQGPRRADRRRRAGEGLRPARRAARRGRGEDRRRAERRAGQPGRPRRLLLRRQGQGRRGDAAQPDVQRGARGALRPPEVQERHVHEPAVQQRGVPEPRPGLTPPG